ncbi:MAG: hypothetical protein ABEI86_10340 [Halobacteriaceae archaeon]
METGRFHPEESAQLVMFFDNKEPEELHSPELNDNRSYDDRAEYNP